MSFSTNDNLKLKMSPLQTSKSFRHFTKHLFLASKVSVERNKAKKDLDNHLQKMRKSIIRMSLSYTDLDKLKAKVDNLISWERKYAKLFKPEDNEVQELKNQINVIQQELKNEREEKLSIISENNERIMELNESLNNVKNQMRHLHMEKAKRQNRLNALEKRIRQKIDLHSYYHS